MLDQAQADSLAQALTQVLETFSGDDALFAPDAFFDINVPSWRFQLDNPRDFMQWCADAGTRGFKVTPKAVVPTAEGFLFEYEAEYTNMHGEPLFFRNVVICKVAGERITELTYWCTGEWDEEQLAHHRDEVTLLRP
jgi:hypothetical protein